MILKQEVYLSITDSEGNSIFESNGLRVDFDVRHINGFSRATFKIWNMNDATIKSVMSGDRYVTVRTKLHGRNDFLVANKFYVSNAHDETTLPNTVVTLFCYDKLHKDVFEQPLPSDGVTVKSPVTLKRCVAAILKSVGYVGKVDYLYFPNNLENNEETATIATFDGRVDDAIIELARQYNFRMFLVDGVVTMVHTPDLDSVPFTNLAEATPIKLRTDMMQSNPTIGPASLNIRSNLDSRLVPGEVLDISQLLTAGVNSSENDEVADGYYSQGIAGFSLYTILEVQHKGSNYTKDWFSSVFASAPTKGEVAPTFNWFAQ